MMNMNGSPEDELSEALSSLLKNSKYFSTTCCGDNPSSARRGDYTNRKHSASFFMRHHQSIYV